MLKKYCSLLDRFMRISVAYG